MSVVQVQPMQAEELGWLVEAEARINRFPWSHNQFSGSVAAGHPIWILHEEGSAAGYAVTMPIVDEIELLNIGILPEKQRRGLGRALLNQLITQAQTASLRRMFLEVRVGNAAARKLYQNTGFTVIGERRNYYPAPGGFEDAIVMAKDL